MKFQNSYDPALTITVRAPDEDAIAAYFNAQAAKLDYQPKAALLRACAVEPSGHALDELLRQWSGLPDDIESELLAAAGYGPAWDLYDVRAILDAPAEHADTLQAWDTDGVTVPMVREWLAMYPRRGPVGRSQLVMGRAPFGTFAARAPEPLDWFSVDGDRRAGRHYEALRKWVQACTLFPSVPTTLALNAKQPAIVTTMGAIIRQAAGEGLAKRVGE